jgi:hypothetical protein
MGPGSIEIARQYRVAKQTLAMHADLRDRHAAVGTLTEVVLLVFSALVTATTFAGAEFYSGLRVPPDVCWLLQGALGVLAFTGSVVLLIVDPRGKSARHADAAAKWWPVVDQFRRCRLDDRSWRPEDLAGLGEAYAAACAIVAPIPDSQFNQLKSRYLMKVAVSSLKDRYPGCPLIFLRLCLVVRDTSRAIASFVRGGLDANKDGRHE